MNGAGGGTADMPAALRFVFRVTASGVELVSRDSVLMTPLPTHDVEAVVEPHSGSRLELQDDEGNILYRRTGGPAPDAHAEIYMDDPERPFMRSVTPPIGSLFTIVIPDLPSARTLVLFGSTQSVESAEELPAGSVRRSSRSSAVRELVRIPVREGSHPGADRDHQ